MAFLKTKKNFSESFLDSKQKENFPRFTILESEDDTPLIKLSPFFDSKSNLSETQNTKKKTT